MRNVFIQGLAAASMVIATTGTVGMMSSAEAAPTTATSQVQTAQAQTPQAQTAQAQAAKGCVSKKEFKKIKKGMSQAKVARIFGTKGSKESVVKKKGKTIMARGYRGCPQYSAVGVAFIKKGGTFKMANKVATWNR
ncbi:hypothetical protein ASG90_00785 [Nocardioides sp. Soil797]|nr:hypothetical protein ASG90_00785 [Nocardioides sp. Soil797]